MHPGETVHVQILRKGEYRDIAVPLFSGKRVPMPFTLYPRLGAVRQDSWLEHTLDSLHLRPWADSIAKQIRNITDVDYCTVPFTSRPSPFRLNAVTYCNIIRCALARLRGRLTKVYGTVQMRDRLGGRD